MQYDIRKCDDYFLKRNINIDITPPIVLTGENIQLSINRSIIISIPLIFEDGTSIEMVIFYEDKK